MSRPSAECVDVGRDLGGVLKQKPCTVVSYFGNRCLHHFERDLEEIRGHGFDAVLHCVTEADR